MGIYIESLSTNKSEFLIFLDLLLRFPLLTDFLFTVVMLYFGLVTLLSATLVLALT